VTVQIGTSGWQYAYWRGRLYPKRLPQRLWLEHYAERLAFVEVNATFYRLPSRTAVEGWRRRTPPDFTFAVKASRYLTHVRRLREPREPVRRLMDAVEPLGDRLGPVLLQLQDVDVLRIVVRNGFSRHMAEHLVVDLKRTVARLEATAGRSATGDRTGFHH
jgi:uncharacterized protein YecE (DUF72 family)